jgi:hypothetical protein
MREYESKQEPDTDTDDARREFDERAEALLEELRAGAISEAEYERRKAEAWEVYRAVSGRLVPDEDDRGRQDTTES